MSWPTGTPPATIWRAIEKRAYGRAFVMIRAAMASRMPIEWHAAPAGMALPKWANYSRAVAGAFAVGDGAVIVIADHDGAHCLAEISTAEWEVMLAAVPGDIAAMQAMQAATAAHYADPAHAARAAAYHAAGCPSGGGATCGHFFGGD